ncbi:hypothetical protein DL769_008129 [Monosporascus sp. CRB-8-3]|nr:hypothetical protein DL769_008129 [Monosporascus sp. CRB-8-3]
MRARSSTETGTEPQWPPRSPHEALLGTPSGRERYRRMVERASPSPSPTKGARNSGLSARTGNTEGNGIADDTMDLDDEEDEEILQLKLQAIQAKLKLKKLQSAKAKKASESAAAIVRPQSAPIPDELLANRTQPRAEGLRPGPTIRPLSQAEVQVPASPVRKAPAAPDQTSPSRVRLGIDKGLRGKDVSLKRPPGLKKASETQNGSQGAGRIQRVHTSSQGAANGAVARERPKTFSERLAAARSEEASRKERQERIKQARTAAFELGKEEMEHFKHNAMDIPDIPQEPEQFSREEVLSSCPVKRSNGHPSRLRRPSQDENRSSSVSAGSSFEASDMQSKENAGKKRASPSDVPEEEASGFEPYSSVHLSKRIIPHPVLTRNLSGKKTYVIQDLLKHVKAPDFSLPEIEQDIVVFGILASKSDPRSHKPTSNPKEKAQSDPARGKYMVLTLVDLQWELELFLFNTGFDRFWKLTPGTLLAILNPTVMPPPPGRTDTGRFSLVINSGQDTILEVGTARDLAFCKSVKKDGQLCNSWVNRKRTEFCEFHMNAALSKHRQARQDINAFDTGLGPGTKKHNSRRLQRWEEHTNSDPASRARGRYDRETHSHWFVSKATSAASMLDNDLLPGQVAERVERGEALRRRLATEEKERDLMKKLGRLGSGAGREYMQLGERQKTARATAAAPGNSSSSSGLGNNYSAHEDARHQQEVDAKSLGLLGGKGAEQPKISLSPVKRKRAATATSTSSSSFTGTAAPSTAGDNNAGSRPSGGGASTTTTTATGRSASALGWGGALKDKLARMKDGEKFSRQQQQQQAADQPPVRKKTRFVTEKGIREAGRESLGGANAAGVAAAAAAAAERGTRRGGGGGGRMVVLDNDDDNDDELVIVR